MHALSQEFFNFNPSTFHDAIASTSNLLTKDYDKKTNNKQKMCTVFGNVPWFFIS